MHILLNHGAGGRSIAKRLAYVVFQRLRPLAIPLLAAISLGGCSELWPRLDLGQSSPSGSTAVPRPLGLPLHYNYRDPAAQDYFVTKFNSASDKKAERNAILFELMSIVDTDFDGYAKAVRSDRAYKDTLVTITSLALTGTAAAMGGGAAATLSAIDTGIKGANAAVDKNAFGDIAPALLLSQMETDRSNVAGEIYDKMSKSISAFTLDEGLRDIGRYYNAGSVTTALIALSNKTAKDSNDAKTAAATKKAAIQ